jgi:endonuclease I
MKKESIKSHLQPYSITKKRQTTINHAFASAIAPNDIYAENLVKEAVESLGQDPEEHLLCVYCGEPAETWDHVFGLVKNFKFSGYGHVIGNLLPCCKKCNSKKGNKHWEEFLNKKNKSNAALAVKVEILKRYFEKYLPEKVDYERIKSICPVEIKRLESIKTKIIRSIKEADTIAERVRRKIKEVT